MVIDGNSSVRFADTRWLLFRVISAGGKSTYEGWAWIQGYPLNSAARRLSADRSSCSTPGSATVDLELVV
ncbi:hypothetical protein [Actinoplanes sp. HUAS TT8]|uniref:hypothetical protein n=1 Tax=Actinoplanes sp. HUAS TT8 TaxID=3447453 RepID=UPI003F51FC50